MNIHYFWWPLTVALVYTIHAYASFYNKGATGWKPFLSVWGIGILITPLWPIISRVSNKLLFDGMLFDLILFLVYTITFMVLEKHYISFKPINYIGIGFVMLGMILIKKS
jgi:hypothetical protein